MPSDRALSPETRAVKMAADEMRKVMASFSDPGSPRFMGQRRSRQTERTHELVANSQAASRLVTDGYSLEFAYRVAKMEDDFKKRDPLAALVDAAGGLE